jgi:hypothetical protein
MKNWGIAISALYAIVIAALALPLWLYLTGADLDGETVAGLLSPEPIGEFLFFWITLGLLVVTQAALLFIAVDRTGNRLKPRRRLGTAIVATSFTVALLCLAIISNIAVILLGDEGFNWGWFWIALPAVLWIGWGIVFFLYRERLSGSLTRTVGWLLNGSVLQLLIAVPAHIVARERDDCCAPIFSGFGIASGIALMLVAFGPSVLFLYQDRLRRQERRSVMPLLAKWPVWTLVATLVVGGALLWPVLQPDEAERTTPAPSPLPAAPAAENP